MSGTFGAAKPTESHVMIGGRPIAAYPSGLGGTKVLIDRGPLSGGRHFGHEVKFYWVPFP